MPVAPQGLDGDEEVGGASAHVLVVGSRRLAGSNREGCAYIPMQGHGLLIEADDGTQCVKRLGVESESVLYGGDKGSAHPGQAPLLVPPGLQLIFFENRPHGLGRDTLNVPELDQLLTQQAAWPMDMTVRRVRAR